MPRRVGDAVLSARVWLEAAREVPVRLSVVERPMPTTAQPFEGQAVRGVILTELEQD